MKKRRDQRCHPRPGSAPRPDGKRGALKGIFAIAIGARAQLLGVALLATASPARAQQWHVETVRALQTTSSDTVDLAVAPDGRPVLSYEQQLGREDWRLSVDAYPWGGGPTIYQTTGELYSISLSLTGRVEEALVATTHPSETTPGNRVVSVFGGFERVFFGGECSRLASLDSGPDGAGHLAYYATSCRAGDSFTASLRYASNRSGRWISEPVVDVQFRIAAEFTFSLKVGPTGRPAIAWTRNRGERALYYSERGASGAWSHQRLLQWDDDPISGDEHVPIHGIALGLSPSGDPHIVVPSDPLVDALLDPDDPLSPRARGFLLYYTRAAGKWTRSVLTLARVMPSIAVDSQSRPHVVYRDTSSGEIVSMTIRGGDWIQRTIDRSAGTQAWRPPALSIDDADGLHVAYFASSPAVPEDFEIRYASLVDCNGNGVHDRDEIVAGSSDCNQNGRPDACDLALGTSADCDRNGVPDDCEDDCNENGVADVCELRAGALTDCDLDGVPDDCESLFADPEVVEGGFETLDTDVALPVAFGRWGLDEVAAVPAEQGITPFEGERMLRFVASGPVGSGSEGAQCDLHQLVGLCRVDLRDRPKVAVARARFNRVRGDAETDRLFQLTVTAHPGAAEDYPSRLDLPLAEASREIEADANPATWEELSVLLPIPVSPEYLSVRLAAIEDVADDARGDEFDGHYCDGVTLAICDATLAGEPRVEDGSFEDRQPDPGLPSVIGFWGLDQASAVPQENRIAPLDGSRMLRFDATDASGPRADRSGADIVQLISLCAAGSESRFATLRASFNRVAGDAETDREFQILLRAFAGFPEDFDGSGEIAGSEATLVSDADPATWEEISTTLEVPPGADYLGVWVVAREDIVNDGSFPELDGHYVDRVILELGPARPAATFRRSDCNDDGTVDISDAVFELAYLFLGDVEPRCPDACDTNDDGVMDISDAVATLGELFLGIAAIPPPGRLECGRDPTADPLECRAGSACSSDGD